MKYRVTMISMDFNTRRKTSERQEIIDTEDSLFLSCNTEHHILNLLLIDKILEAFWNLPNAKEIVKVVDIEEL